MIDFDALTAYFAPSELEWKPGATSKDETKALAMAYMDARAVQNRLDRVVGPERWQKRLISTPGGMICDLGIKVDDEWVWKAGASQDTDFESVKGADSGAFKRAASAWGIGRYLYDLKSIWVPCEKRGKRVVFLSEPQLPDWAIPGDVSRAQEIATDDHSKEEYTKMIMETLNTLRYVNPLTIDEGREIIQGLSEKVFKEAYKACVVDLDEKRVEAFWKKDKEQQSA